MVYIIVSGVLWPQRMMAKEWRRIILYHQVTSMSRPICSQIHLTVAAIIFNHIKSIGLIIFCGLFAIITGLYKNSNELN